MNRICAVCQKGKSLEKCEVCGFSNNAVVENFLTMEDANRWLITVVNPYRIKWEAEKQIAELQTQLEVAKKNEVDLLTQIDEKNEYKRNTEPTKKHKKSYLSGWGITIMLFVFVFLLFISLKSLDFINSFIVNDKTLISQPANIEFAKKNDIINFGNHSWRVLDVQYDKILIISENIIGNVYNWGIIQKWETHCMRKYLNGKFLKYFTNEQKSRIIKTQIANSNNPWFATKGGNDTNDFVFLLSIEEAVKYFGDSGQFKNGNPKSKYSINDQYNTERIAKNAKGKARGWFLRSPGSSFSLTAYVRYDGSISVGDAYIGDCGGLRPAMWIRYKNFEDNTDDQIKNNDTIPLVALTGTVSINGIPRVGKTLTANIDNLGGNGIISYQWKRGNTNVGTNSNTYVLRATDIDSKISVIVTRTGNSGSIISAQTSNIASSVTMW